MTHKKVKALVERHSTSTFLAHAMQPLTLPQQGLCSKLQLISGQNETFKGRFTVLDTSHHIGKTALQSTVSSLKWACLLIHRKKACMLCCSNFSKICVKHPGTPGWIFAKVAYGEHGNVLQWRTFVQKKSHTHFPKHSNIFFSKLLQSWRTEAN